MNTGPIIALTIVALLLVFGAIRAAYGYWVVRRDAADEWDVFCRQNNSQAKKTSRDQFISAYKQAHNPRGLAYSVAALGLGVLVTPLAVMALTFFYANVIVQEFDPNAAPAQTVAEEVRRQFRRDGPLIYSFFLFFGLIASWGGVAWLVARWYHRSDDIEFGDNLRSVRGDAPLAKVKAVRKRPKWSPLVQSDAGLVLGKARKPKKSEVEK